MAWEPPLSLEERLKALVVPGRIDLLYHLWRERRRGEREIGLVPFLADPTRLSLDIGANRGIWAEAMRRHSRGVHAFEPNPKIFRMLRRGLGPGVTAHPVALSDASGTAELRVPLGSRGYSNQGASLSREKIGAAAYGSVVVETRRLDELGLGPVGFIKIDVEGFEQAVVEGARETLQRHRPALVIEMEEAHAKRPIAEQIAAVEAHGYEAFALDRGRLRRVAEIDLAARHAQGVRREDYIFNWIFLPR